MQVNDYFLYLIIGKVFIYFLQKFPTDRIIKFKFLQDLIKCDLCLGWWVYTGLAFLFLVNPFSIYYIFLGCVFTGSLSTLLVHLLSVGWKSEFGITWIKDE